MSDLTKAAADESNLAEAELANMSVEERAEALAEAKPGGPANGQANGAAAVASEPGEQGIATQDDVGEDKAPTVWERPVGAVEKKNAGEVLRNLESNAQDMAPEAVIDALIAVVDVHPELTIQHEWPGTAEEEYRESPIIERIGLLLCRGCPKIEISGR